jgi:hypothetical protein
MRGDANRAATTLPTTRAMNEATLQKLDWYRITCEDFMDAVGAFLDGGTEEKKTEYQTLYPANLEVEISDYNRGLLLEAAMKANTAAVSQCAVRLSLFDIMDSRDNLLRDLPHMPGINTPMFYYRLFQGSPSVGHIEDLCMGG